MSGRQVEWLLDIYDSTSVSAQYLEAGSPSSSPKAFRHIINFFPIRSIITVKNEQLPQ